MRFSRTDDARGHGAKVLSRTEVGPDEARALFMARLWALFGPATPIDDGFEYVLGDRETGIAFTAYSGASGPSYGASISRDELLPVARALEEIEVARIPWPKPLPAVAELWLSSWERARAAARK